MIRTWPYWAVGVFFFLAMVYWTRVIDDFLGFTNIVNGWVLFGTILFLALFNIRKRLSMLPLASASKWLLLHTVIGSLAVPFFWLHTGTVWPEGFYDQVMTLLFYAVALSGVLGLWVQKIFPARLTRSGSEYVFERIPNEVYRIRSEAEQLLLACARETGSDTLARHYVETLQWFFHRPRFFWTIVLDNETGEHWVRQQFSILDRYLNQDEKKYLNQLMNLADAKRMVDLHYVLQRVMKSWLFVHIPLVAGVMVLIFWHIAIIHVYYI